MTGSDQGLLAVALDELAESSAPPSGLDAGRAIREGRRLRLRRRLAAGGASIALVAALGGGIAVLAQRGAAPDPATPVPSPRWLGSATPHDPLTVPATFGWLPQGMTPAGYWGYEVGPVAAVALGAKPASGSGLRPMLTLFVYPAGKIPRVFPKGTTVPRSLRSHVLPAPSVGGQEAYWYSSSATDALDGGQPMLRWRTEDGRWAELTGENLPAQGLAQTLLRAAADIRLGERLVPMPLRVADWPASTRVQHAGVSMNWMLPQDPQGWQFSVTFEISGYTVDLGIGHGSGAPNPTEGLPDPSEPMECATSHGLTYCVHHMGREKLPPALTAIGGLKGLLAKITPLGPDPRNWTTNVLR